MSLRLYNSLTRRTEAFEAIDPACPTMYVCGPTVYNYVHIGNARGPVVFGVLADLLRRRHGALRYARNITDIDDKIIARAVATNRLLSEVTSFYTDAMHADERALGVLKPDAEPRATAYVGDMIDIIKRLQENDLAYQADDGDVNYAVRNFPEYGKLSGKTLDDLRAGERVAVVSSKRDPLDFVLWKSAKPEEPEESKWESPYGLGRPGWHIECSAMSRALLGLPLDIHGGGPDLKFPHHENEIAQTEGAFGGQLASLWMHCGPLMVNDDKMSKSLGNFSTIRAVVGNAESISDDSADYQANLREAEMLRFFIVRNHYRSPQNYSSDNLLDAQNALDRLYQTLLNVSPSDAGLDWEHPQAQAFRRAMNDDFNTAGAVAVLFELATQANRDNDGDSSALMQHLGNILGLLQTDPDIYVQTPSRYQRGAAAGSGTLSAEQIEAHIQARSAAKDARDYAEADRIRDLLHEHGIELEDKAGGATQWRRR